MKKGRLSSPALTGAASLLVVSRAHLSIASSGEDQVGSDAPAAHLRRGSSSDQSAAWGLPGANGSFLVSMCQIAVASSRAMLDPGDLGAALAAEALLGPLVALLVAGCRAAWVAASMSAQRRYLGPFLASGPRSSRPPDWRTTGRARCTRRASWGWRTGRCRRSRRRSCSPSTQAMPGDGHEQRDVRVVGAHRPQLPLAGVDLGVELVDEAQARGERRRPGLGDREAPRAAPGPAPRTGRDTGTGWPKAMSVAWIRFFRAVRWRTRWSRKRARSRSARTAGSGSQIAGTRSRRASSARTQASILSVLAASGARPLTLTGHPRSRRPSRRARAVVDEAGAVHRLDRRAHLLAVAGDAGDERRAARRRRGGRRSPRRSVRPRRARAHQASGATGPIRRTTCPGPPGAGSVRTQRCHRGGPSS